MGRLTLGRRHRRFHQPATPDPPHPGASDCKVDSGRVALAPDQPRHPGGDPPTDAWGRSARCPDRHRRRGLDCCDNFATRHAVNGPASTTGNPWSRAAIRFDGQIASRPASGDDSPLLPLPCSRGETWRKSLRRHGVFAPLTGIIGTCRRPRPFEDRWRESAKPRTGQTVAPSTPRTWNGSVRFKKDPGCAVWWSYASRASPGYRPDLRQIPEESGAACRPEDLRASRLKKPGAPLPTRSRAPDDAALRLSHLPAAAIR